jgi:hypothetical protein
MLNINEDELKKVIVERAVEGLVEDEHLSGLVAKEVKARIDKIFIDRAQAAIDAAIDQAVQNSFDREYQRITSWGEPDGPKTTIRAQLEKTVDGYWSARVEPKTGKVSTSSYGTVTRAEYLMTQVCAEDFSENMKQSVQNVTGALKDGLRNQLAAQMDNMLNELFRIKSLQDQGKVAKPY